MMLLTKLKKILELPRKKTFTLLIGVPHSGKSTLADLMRSKYPTKRSVISSDAIRLELLDYKSTGVAFDQSREPEVWKVVKEKTYKELSKINVQECILDATNVTKWSRLDFIEMGRENNRIVKFIVLNISIAEVIKRNNARQRKIPENILRKFFEIYQKPGKNEFDKIQHLDSRKIPFP